MPEDNGALRMPEGGQKKGNGRIIVLLLLLVLMLGAGGGMWWYMNRPAPMPEFRQPQPVKPADRRKPTTAPTASGTKPETAQVKPSEKIVVPEFGDLAQIGELDAAGAVLERRKKNEQLMLDIETIQKKRRSTVMPVVQEAPREPQLTAVDVRNLMAEELARRDSRPPVDEKPANALQKPSHKPAGVPEIVSILGKGGGMTAVVRLANGSVVRVRKGSRLGKGTVGNVSRRGITLVTGGKSSFIPY